MNGRRSRRGRTGTPRRKSSHRPFKTTLLIICEGKTERNYFDQLKRDDEIRGHFAVRVKRGKGGSREQIARFSVDCRNNLAGEYDEVWCVMDVEDPAERSSLDKALEILQQNSVLPCLSNPAFEIWLLAHFERTAKSFQDCDAVVAALHRHWQKRFSMEYKKEDRHIFIRVSKFTADALCNAKWVREKHHDPNTSAADCNSCTEVYRLLERLVPDAG